MDLGEGFCTGGYAEPKPPGHLVDDFRQLFPRFAPGAADDRRLTIYADLVMGMVMALGEGLLDGRYDDPQPLARELTLASFAIARAALENPPDSEGNSAQKAKT